MSDESRLEKLVEEEQDVVDQYGDWTIDQLAQLYGEEAVRRGLSYIANLSEADKQYRQSADGEEYKRRTAQEITGDEDSAPDDWEPQSKWEKAVETGGLGLEEDD